MAKIELYGKDLPENEYRLFRTEPDKRCGRCAFIGKRIGGVNYMCVKFDQTTNEFAGCNKFQPDRPQRPQDGPDIDAPWPYRGDGRGRET